MLRTAVMKTYELHAPADLSDLRILAPEVQARVKAADVQSFILAMTVVIGGGYILISPTGGDVKLAAAGFIGVVLQYFFGNKVATTTAAATIAAANQGAAQQAADPNGVKP